eukprot:gene38453-56329_t
MPREAQLWDDSYQPTPNPMEMVRELTKWKKPTATALSTDRGTSRVADSDSGCAGAAESRTRVDGPKLTARGG